MEALLSDRLVLSCFDEVYLTDFHLTFIFLITVRRLPRDMLEAILECSQPHNWIKIAVGKYSSTMEILDSKMLPNNVMQHFFQIQVKPERTEELIREIRKDKDVKELEVTKSKSGNIYGSATSFRCTVCRAVAKSRCFLESVTINSEHVAQWKVLGNNESFGQMTRALEGDKISFNVKLRKNLEERDLLLTGRQEQILSIAFERGYFDFPKKIGLKDLARQIGIETSTLAEILRRGQRKILEEYLTRRSLVRKDMSNRGT